MNNPSASPAPHEIAQFQVVRRLGAGGMAEVFLAKKLGAEGTFKVLVLKRILPAHGSSQDGTRFCHNRQIPPPTRPRIGFGDHLRLRAMSSPAVFVRARRLQGRVRNLASGWNALERDWLRTGDRPKPTSAPDLQRLQDMGRGF